MRNMTRPSQSATSTKRLVWEFVATGVLILVLYYPTLKALVSDWNIDPNYSHGFFVPFISGYLVWEKRVELKKANASPSLWGLPILLTGPFVLIAGTIGSELFTKRFSFLIVLVGALFLLSGKEITRLLLFPIFFLAVMIPIPYILYDVIAFPLKLLASKVACWCLLLFGIPVFREGNIIHLDSTTLEIVDACSGIRSLVSLITLGVIFAHLSQNRLWKKIVLILSTIPIAVIANMFRVTGTGILAHYFGPEVATGFLHTFSGWLIFIVAFALLFAVGIILRKTAYRS